MCNAPAALGGFMAKRLTPADFEVSDAEREAARVAAEGGAGARTVGKTVGSLVGTGLGALGFLAGPLAPVVAPATMAAGSGLGGVIGDAIGGAVAEGDIDEANEALTEYERKRQEKLAQYRLKQDALAALLSED
jgi:hypothetical protein